MSTGLFIKCYPPSDLAREAWKRIRRLSLQTGHTRDGYGITAARRDIRYVARLPVESSVDGLLAVFVRSGDPWIPIVRVVRGAALAMVGPSA